MVALASGSLSTDNLVRDLYCGLAEEVSFRPCLLAMGKAFRAHLTALHSEALLIRTSGLEMMGEIEGDEFQRLEHEYGTRWLGKNLWIERGIKDLLQRGYGTGEEVVSTRELHASEYYRYFLRPVDVHFGMGINVQAEGNSSVAILTVNRSMKAGAFDAADVALVRAIRPHLVNAYAIYRRFSLADGQSRTLRACFDRSTTGVMVLGVEGEIVECNAVASRMLDGGHRLGRGPGLRLHLHDAAPRARLRAALRALGDPSGQGLPEVLVIDSVLSPCSPGLAINLCPLRGAGWTGPRGRVLAFLSDLETRAPGSSASTTLMLAFDLTPAEAMTILSLRAHHDPAGAARALGIATSTVRCHLKHAFRKTGTTRQSELLRLADRLLGSVPN